MEAKIDGKNLIIIIPLNNPPERSASGKTLVVASSHGNKATAITIQNQPVIIGVNAYIKP